ASRFTRSNQSCPTSRSGRRWQLTPSKAQLRQAEAGRFPARSPTSGCLSGEYTRPSRFGCGSAHLPVRQPPDVGTLGRTPSVAGGLPTRRHLARCSPVAALERATGRRSCEPVHPLVDLGQRPIHRLRDTVGGVTGHVLGKGSAVHLAPRSLRAPGEPLSLI